MNKIIFSTFEELSFTPGMQMQVIITPLLRIMINGTSLMTSLSGKLTMPKFNKKGLEGTIRTLRMNLR